MSSRDKQMLSLKQGLREGGRVWSFVACLPLPGPPKSSWEGQVFEALGSCFMGRVPPPTPN